MGRPSLHLQLIDPALQLRGAAFTFGTSRLVTGPYKAVARWCVVFFTPKGTDPLDGGRGTEFPALVGGNVTDPSVLEGFVHGCVDDATAQVLVDQRRAVGLTTDELLAEATVTAFRVFARDRFEFHVTLRTASGARVTVPVPYAT